MKYRFTKGRDKMGNSNELTAQGFIKKLAGFSMASWLSAAISFLVTPLFTRLYVPEEVGHINLFITFTTFFQTLSVFALDQAFMRFYNENLEGLCKENLLSYCLKINMTISLLLSVIILMGNRFFSVQISGEESFLIPICLSVAIICSTFLRMSSVSSRMEKNIVQYTIQVVLMTCVEKVIFTCSALFRPEHELAILFMTSGYVILCGVFFMLKRKSSILPVHHVPRNTTEIILKFSVPYLPVLLLSWLNNSIPLLVLKRYVNFSSIGIYTNAVTISSILTILQTGFTAYWSPFIYEHYKDDRNKEKIQRIERIVIITLLFAAINIVLFQDIIYLLVGENFRASKVFFPFLMLTPVCNVIADMTGIGIMLSKKSYLNIFVFLGNSSVNLILSFILVPKIGVVGAGIAVGISALVMVSIRSYLGGRYYRISESYRFIIESLFLLICACIVNILFAEQFFYKSLLLSLILIILFVRYKNEFLYLIRLSYRFLINSIRRHRK